MKARGKHRWNSCGSEAGRDERKQTESRVRRTGKEDTGNQVGWNGENQRSESGKGAPEEATVRQSGEEEERKKQKAK